MKRWIINLFLNIDWYFSKERRYTRKNIKPYLKNLKKLNRKAKKEFKQRQ